MPGSTGWHEESKMARYRWYPTNTTLSDGTVLTTSGLTEPIEVLKDTARYPELWQNGNWKRLKTARKDLPLYPWMFQAPNSQVFYAGAGNDLAYLNPVGTGAWTPAPPLTPPRAFGERTYGTAAMFWPDRVLIAGGCDGNTVTNTAEILDLTSGTDGADPASGLLRPVVTRAPDMHERRWHANSTILPDGTILVTGGSRVNGASDPNQGVLEAEIWTPASGPNGPTGPGTWTTVAPMKEARMYHSTAVLLPDGRVLSAGGEENINYKPFQPNVNNHCTAETYSPPYLFKGARPVIGSAPSYVGYGQPFRIQATPGSGTLARATLVRLSSVTHSFNMNQRFLELSFGPGPAGTLTATAPGNANDCPPGHYLLFVLNSQGVPSEAKTISIGSSTCGATVSVSTTVTASTCTASAVATVSGTNINTDYRWFIDGVYQSGYNNQPSVTVPLDNCRPLVTFAVEVTPSCGGSPVYNFQSASVGSLYANGSICGCGLSE